MGEIKLLPDMGVAQAYAAFVDGAVAAQDQVAQYIGADLRLSAFAAGVFAEVDVVAT